MRHIYLHALVLLQTDFYFFKMACKEFQLCLKVCFWTSSPNIVAIHWNWFPDNENHKLEGKAVLGVRDKLKQRHNYLE